MPQTVHGLTRQAEDMALHLSDLYRPSTTEKVLDLERDLKQELEELRQEIDESDIVQDSPARAFR